ncbi:MAG: ATP-binding cassette domain-containing protein [Gemmatimonadota bacterium]
MLRGVDLRVAPASSLVLTGPNGAGKTTLLRIIATLLRPSSGTGSVAGFDLRGGAERIRGRVGYLSARGFLYDELGGAENLRFAARMTGVEAGPARIAELLEAAGLADAGEQRVRTYSTGMRRRLALAALRMRPLDVALLDEPYAGLDADGIGQVDRIVSRFRESGTAVIIASHQAGEATRTADQALRLEAGRLQPAGPV